ncbi:acetyl-CoA carboxyl transferase [Wenjunlia vitaminophila]|uniref:Acetyl-coenzyme A carboxylase carboxyl transferase subunits beta/alpha n=1 Tax=Wenjunlia vitaminophila TaxID=76728 RepID=A0A0T6LU65_WENVI|nr:carboxyl transferase domain-containing protein [Wenjunlia vitaminophila]KRV49621.1 acetyl-CoA carboxyl transferase [Wenjunlia vitaminophila]
MPRSRELIAATLDPGSWVSWDEPAGELPDDPDYRDELLRARARTGLDESVLSGEGTVRGRRVAVITCEFEFLAGSIGVTAGERLVSAVERATARRLPLLAAPASAGTRMQEGTVAFLQMVKVAAAISDHKAAGLPYLVYLRHPTMGGVLASWGSLGHLTAAEPGALIGFLGPRVHQALYGEAFPEGVQVAENLLAHGLVDAVLPVERLHDTVADALDVLCAPVPPTGPGPRHPGEPAEPGTPAGPAPPAEESIRRSRREDRPRLRALLRTAARVVLPLSGTGAGERDPAFLLALARFGDVRCVVLGHDKGRLGPAGLREARRGMRLAAELDLPLVSVIDTGGAALSRESEEGGLAGEIARCLAELVTLPAPTLCLLLGEGAGGAALALAPADRVVAARHAWLSPLPPEGASAILYRTTDRAAEVARRQGVRSADLLARRIVDRVVEEHPDAADQPDAFLARLGGVLEAELAALRRADPAERMAARRARYRSLGRS